MTEYVNRESLDLIKYTAWLLIICRRASISTIRLGYNVEHAHLILDCKIIFLQNDLTSLTKETFPPAPCNGILRDNSHVGCWCTEICQEQKFSRPYGVSASVSDAWRILM